MPNRCIAVWRCFAGSPMGWNRRRFECQLSLEQGDGQTIVLVAVDTFFLMMDSGAASAAFEQKYQHCSGRLTHFAPALAKSVQSLGSVDEEYCQAVLVCIAKAIMTGTGPSSAYIGHFTAPTNMTVNRRWRRMIDYSALRRGRLILQGISLAENPDGIGIAAFYCVSFRDAMAIR